MKGFITLDIPTKPYIKAYVLHKMGPAPKMVQSNSFISKKLYDLLQHETNRHGAVKISSMYTEKLRVYIPTDTYHRRGGNLNATNLKNFNGFLEDIIKHRFYELMDESMCIFDSFTQNLPDIRSKLGIDLEAWSDDSMKKDYYRYRKSLQKSLAKMSPQF